MTRIFVETSFGQVAVWQSRDNGFPVFFVHGNSLSSATFINQFNDPHLSRFRLISLDLPGHGDTGRMNNPEEVYSPFTYIKLIIELCHKLDAADGVLVGHSLGGHLAISALEYLPALKGALIFGTPPLTNPPRMDRAFIPGPALAYAFKPDLTEDETALLASGFIKAGGNVSAEISESIGKADPLVRLYIGKALMGGNAPDENGKISLFKKPFALLHGENDQLVNREYFNEFPVPGLWRNDVQLIPDSGHSPQLEQPVLFNGLILQFIKEL